MKSIEELDARTVSFQTEEGNARGYLATPASTGPPILVLHAWWGLNDFFKDFTRRLAGHGFISFAPDMNEGHVFSTVPEANDAAEKRKFSSVSKVVLGAADYLRSHSKARGSRIGVVGFSMGAGFALWLASQRPKEVAAAVAYYGIQEVDPARVEAAILGHFVPNDEWESYDYVQRVEKSLRTAGRNVTFYTYPKAKHWFVEENRPNDYDPESSRLAWERTLAFLIANLQHTGQ